MHTTPYTPTHDQTADALTVAALERLRAGEQLARWERIDWWQGQFLGEATGPCGIPWPPSLHDAAPLPCAAPRGHQHPHTARGVTW
jgi:hypothetical protein